MKKPFLLGFLALWIALALSPSVAAQQAAAPSQAATAQSNAGLYHNDLANADAWLDDQNHLADAATQKLLNPALPNYASGKLVSLDSTGKTLVLSSAPIYRKSNGKWVDDHFTRAPKNVEREISKHLRGVKKDSGWYTLDGRDAVWTQHGGYAAGPNDISQAHDYARPVGSPNDPKLSTGWTGPKGDRTVHVRDYYRTTKSGKTVHVHGYYRSKSKH